MLLEESYAQAAPGRWRGLLNPPLACDILITELYIQNSLFAQAETLVVSKGQMKQMDLYLPVM